jgi:hypothetical protein
MRVYHLNNKNFILVVLVFCMFFSCDYQSNKEYIQEIEPPSPITEININLFPAGDTLELFQALNLMYQFDAGGRKFYEGYFELGNKKWLLTNQEGQIALKPEDLEPGYHRLLLRAYYKSGSGSVADIAGVETILAETQWVVVSDHRVAPALALSFYKNDKGLLTLTWEPCQQYNFEQYELKRRGALPWLTFIIDDPNQTHFTDSCFFGTEATYTLFAKVKGYQSLGHGNNSFIRVETELPKMSIEPLGLDSLRISWNKTEYAARHTLVRANRFPQIVYLESSVDTSVVVASPEFGNWNTFELSTKAFFNSTCGISRSTDEKNYGIGQSLLGYFRNYVYNFQDNIIYLLESDQVVAYNFETMDIISRIAIQNIGYYGQFASSLNINSLAVTGEFHIYVFPDQHLVNPDIIYLGGGRSGYHIFLTDHNELAITVGNEFRLYNTKNQKLITSFDIVEFPYYSRWAGMGISLDAGYAGIATHNGIWLYQRINNQYEPIYHDQNNYRSILFHPTDPSRVYVSSSHEPGVIQYRLPGFTPEKYWEFPNPCLICNIDPHTGFMLVKNTAAGKLHVLNLDTGQILLSINSSDYSPRLFNNRLLSENGIMLDITPYLPGPFK